MTRITQRRILRRGLALLLGLAVFVAADWGIRAVYLSFRPRADRSFSHRVAHPFYDHGFRPMSVGVDHYGPHSAELAVNSLGLRDRFPRELPRQASRPRLLLLGDSFVEAGCLPWDQTFAGRLQAFGEVRGVEVLNGGVASYCLATETARLTYLVEKERVEIRQVALFPDVSDPRDELFQRLLPDGSTEFVPTGPWEGRLAEKIRAARSFEATFRWLEKHVENRLALTGAAVRNLWLLLRDRKSLRGLHEFHESNERLLDWPQNPEVFREISTEGIPRMLASADRLLALCRRHGISLTVVVYPWPGQILVRDPQTPAKKVWETWCAQNGVAFVSLFELFWGQGDPRQVVERYYLAGDMHWNESGHALVAAELMRRWSSLSGGNKKFNTVKKSTD